MPINYFDVNQTKLKCVKVGNADAVEKATLKLIVSPMLQKTVKLKYH